MSNIPVVSKDLGGDTGRVIRFHSDDFAVYVRKIKKSVNSRLIQKDRALWNKAMAEQILGVG